jgi:hypothetical protein
MMNPSSGSLYNPQCMMCLSGSASAQWMGSTGSFHVDHIMSQRTMMSGMMDLRLVMTSTMPVWGQPFSYMPFSDPMTFNPLAPGSQDTVDSGTINMYGSSMPPGTYYMLLYMREQMGMGGMMSDADWVLFPKQVTCDGLGCSVASACMEDANSMCLVGGRFRVTLDYSGYGANPPMGHGTGRHLTDNVTYFGTVDPTSADVVVKMINFCSLNNSWSVYIGGTTDINTTISITDTATGQISQPFVNPLGQGFQLIRSQVFTCP